MRGLGSRLTLDSEEMSELEAKIEYLDEIGFKSIDLANQECDHFLYYLEKPKYTALHVTDLWTAKEQHNFLKKNGLLNAERVRVKRALLGNVGNITVRDRRAHDQFRDTHSKERLPVLTQNTEKLRNKPRKLRAIETYAMYTKTHSQLELPQCSSTKNYLKSRLSQTRSLHFSPEPTEVKLTQFDGLIEECSKQIETNALTRKAIDQPRLRTRKLPPCKRSTEEIAHKIKRMLANDYLRI
mmetsp:Transcript_17148/g.30817  ORF Transcript_17148/g.30817 Transcript_17148/m.30817 type:complete len:240 (-) Transcript_17148:4787-5506(-)|eukprot:CAMPEP_0204912934 /NCGR_PEP_ID=MMETSP1397-20131031/11001_1 /ASSEMBLY_ACC=CAM_ASM_000891 /TAXON_ID=49980 /ORGANISM="Climacostomum Climacostomum virens, Strain Stock W-24" /LENGTH=239 /DNA_ID=CAMNT_0052084085 /DNA_START=319 /DNA_END=1038 /DNA_ORIENTATION=+